MGLLVTPSAVEQKPCLLLQVFALRIPKEASEHLSRLLRETLEPSRPGFLSYSRNIPMNDLLYRGHTYKAPTPKPKTCLELTYRQEHYNTCRQVGSRPIDQIHLTYRGASHQAPGITPDGIGTCCLGQDVNAWFDDATKEQLEMSRALNVMTRLPQVH